MILRRLQEWPITGIGLHPGGSNYVFVVRLEPESRSEDEEPADDDQLLAIYKPASGERPLRDFPYGTLHLRERGGLAVEPGGRVASGTTHGCQGWASRRRQRAVFHRFGPAGELFHYARRPAGPFRAHCDVRRAYTERRPKGWVVSERDRRAPLGHRPRIDLQSEGQAADCNARILRTPLPPRLNSRRLPS